MYTQRTRATQKCARTRSFIHGLGHKQEAGCGPRRTPTRGGTLTYGIILPQPPPKSQVNFLAHNAQTRVRRAFFGVFCSFAQRSSICRRTAIFVLLTPRNSRVVNLIYGISLKKQRSRQGTARIFVTFCKQFLLTKTKGKYNLPNGNCSHAFFFFVTFPSKKFFVCKPHKKSL